MKILVTNDDGIFADGLWILVRELISIAEVVVVAPDREQSAAGTAVTLWEPLRIRRVNAVVPGVETYAVEGTPSDSVLLALGSLIRGKIDLVVSGINWGMNLGDDIYISGTVSAALQGYLHGHPALAVSSQRDSEVSFQTAARLATLLAGRIKASPSPNNLFLNVNVPNVPLARINRIQITRLANESHINTVTEGSDGKRNYYWLVRQRQDGSRDRKTDVWAVDHGHISVTPLFSSLPTKRLSALLNNLCSGLLEELTGSAG
ncbi:MAG TPA: 5'/3'-nucleotidase SurE [Dehalococcoidia bacterium]|nr:5'/3'-nucleotidase SurE [Dehalococcoidia bacterium]